MTTKFQARVEHQDNATYVKISGVIDEDNELSGLTPQMKADTVLINLSEIERINSCGVRDWVNWLSSIEKQGTHQIVLLECSPSIVNQINLVSNFTGSALVKNFYTPYFCSNCDREKVLLVEARDLAAHPPYKAPSCRCDECDLPMEFDEMEASFFAFLSNAKKLVNEGGIEAILQHFSGVAGAIGEQRLRAKTNLSHAGSSGPSAGSGSSSASRPAAATISSSMQTPGSARRETTSTFSRAHSTTGQKWPLGSDSTLSRVPLAPEPKSHGAWILVGVLVATALALLLYTFFWSGGGHASTEFAAPPPSTTRF